MNRRARRQLARRQRKAGAVAALIDAGLHRAHADGHPFRLIGFTDACSDCPGTADVTLMPDGSATSDVWHDEDCPAGKGTVAWMPAS